MITIDSGPVGPPAGGVVETGGVVGGGSAGGSGGTGSTGGSVGTGSTGGVVPESTGGVATGSVGSGAGSTGAGVGDGSVGGVAGSTDVGGGAESAGGDEVPGSAAVGVSRDGVVEGSGWAGTESPEVDSVDTTSVPELSAAVVVPPLAWVAYPKSQRSATPRPTTTHRAEPDAVRRLVRPIAEPTSSC